MGRVEARCNIFSRQLNYLLSYEIVLAGLFLGLPYWVSNNSLQRRDERWYP